MWDNHEFSWLGWQSLQIFEGKTHPAQTRKVAAMQAFFEYQPARMSRPNSSSLEKFEPPHVVDTAVTSFDDHGLGTEPNNLTALHSLKGYRAIRYGKNMELVVTDQRTFRSEDPMGMAESNAFSSDDFPEFVPQEAMEILDATGTNLERRQTSRDDPLWQAPTVRELLQGSSSPDDFGRRAEDVVSGKVACVEGYLEDLGKHDSDARHARRPTESSRRRRQTSPGQALDMPDSAAAITAPPMSNARRSTISFAITKSQDSPQCSWRPTRASGQATPRKALPPAKFDPVGIAFVTGSISAPGMVEAFSEHRFPKEHALRPLFLGQSSSDTKPQPTVNMLLKHGVRSCLEYSKTGDIAAAHAVSNPNNAPHVSFVDMGGHGYSVVRATTDAIETEFVCIPRPLERSATDDGGPLRYRARFRTPIWKHGESPKMEAKVIEGEHEARFSI